MLNFKAHANPADINNPRHFLPFMINRLMTSDLDRGFHPYSYAGTMGLVQGSSMDRRFFHQLGASLLDRTICASAGAAGYKVTVGASIGTDMERFDEARLIVIWGSNPQTSNVHLHAVLYCCPVPNLSAVNES